MVPDFCNRGKGYFHDFTIRAFYLHAGCGQSLRCFHTVHSAADTTTVDSNNFHVSLAVERLERRKSLGYFHSLLPFPKCALSNSERLRYYMPVSQKAKVARIKINEHPSCHGLFASGQL
jgi:hypothetical protein